MRLQPQVAAGAGVLAAQLLHLTAAAAKRHEQHCALRARPAHRGALLIARHGPRTAPRHTHEDHEHERDHQHEHAGSGNGAGPAPARSQSCCGGESEPERDQPSLPGSADLSNPLHRVLTFAFKWTGLLFLFQLLDDRPWAAVLIAALGLGAGAVKLAAGATRFKPRAVCSSHVSSHSLVLRLHGLQHHTHHMK